MSRTRLLQLALALGPVLYGTAEAATVLHYEPLRDTRVGLGLTAAKPAATATTTEAITLHFNAFSRDFALELEPNGRLADLQQRLRLDAGTGAYRGKVVGRPGSWARVVLTPAGP
ncbi:MAG: hypothetical protein EHM50_02475, partial [Lysobacterales bacterium]